MKNSAEKWAYIEGFEDCYEVSDMGNIRSWYMWTGSHYQKRKEPLLIKPYAKGDGYCYISLSNKGLGIKPKKYYVHRLVAAHFCSKEGYESYEGKLCVNHMNFKRSDNRASNLEWCTHKENTLHYRNTQRANEDLAKRDARTRRKNRRKLEFHKPHVKYLYENTDLSIEGIGKLINVGKDNVAKMLKECDLL